MSERTSEELLTEYLKTKDSDLLDVLYRRMHRKLCTLAIRILDSSEDGEDIVQDVFCKLCELEPQPIRSAESFLFRMVQNMAIDLKRHNESGVRHDMISINAFEEDENDDMTYRSKRNLASMVLVAPDSREEDHGRELSEEVKTAMNNLPEEQREAVELYYARGLTIPETAEILGIKENTAESRIRRGIKALRNALVPNVTPHPSVRPVQAIDPESGAVVQNFASMKDAIEAGGSGRHLRNALKKGSCYRGYLWNYATAV